VFRPDWRLACQIDLIYNPYLLHLSFAKRANLTSGKRFESGTKSNTANLHGIWILFQYYDLMDSQIVIHFDGFVKDQGVRIS
jgi:hypothetical protein